MRALALTAFGAAPEILDIAVPEPAEGEVRVRVRAASVNGFDLAVANGYLNGMMEHRFPVVLGEDFAGTVDALGPGVEDDAVGDRVFGVVTKSFLGDGSIGGLVTVPVAVGLAHLPESASFTDGAALGLAGAAAFDAIAQATENIRLVSTATVLTTLDPVRVYQDFATLDLISHGRAEIIAGRSAFAEPFALFGVNPADLDDTFAEKLDLLLQLRAQETVTWSGRTRPPLHDAEISPRAFTEHLPVWVAVGGTPTSALRAGRLGLPMMLGLIGGTIYHAQRLVDIYRAAGEQAGHGPDRLRLGITSHLYVGSDATSARDDVYPYYHQYLSPETNNGRGWEVSRDQMDALSARGGALMVGSPEQVVDKIVDLGEVSRRRPVPRTGRLRRAAPGPRGGVHLAVRRRGRPAVRHALTG